MSHPCILQIAGLCYPKVCGVQLPLISGSAMPFPGLEGHSLFIAPLLKVTVTGTSKLKIGPGPSHCITLYPLLNPCAFLQLQPL